ncbi:ATP-grasp domain-containing protein [Flavobacterium collinsii]|uniref:ATP-grasp domain-containing protein n=1 Tax=Flavobacterium collinsii TaxID=1114861 RepID=A0ABM9SF71_9FLAO|nr:hypothetical protein [Flavobacterium collinsii]CAA9195488.1 hypothetical protein FLACOL7796_00624 [Flavobacterium collinsii]
MKQILGVFYWHNPTRFGNLELVNDLRNQFQILLITNMDLSYLKGFCDHYIVADYHSPDSVIHQVIEYNKHSKIQGMITLSEGAVSLLADCTQKLNLPGNFPYCARIARNKYMMREKVKELGLSQPKFYKASSIKEASAIYQEEFNGGSLFLKPPCLGGSSFCLRIDSLDQLKREWDYIFDESLLRTKGDPLFEEQFKNGEYFLLMEELLSGTNFLHDQLLGVEFPCFELSVEGFIQGNKTFVYSITDKLLRNNSKYGEEFLWRMHSRVPVLFKEKLIHYVNIINNGIGARTGCSHTEFRIESGDRHNFDVIYENQYYKIRLIETALRPGGAYMQTALKHATGFNSIRAMALQACGLENDERIKFRKPGIMINLWAQKEGIVKKLVGLDKIISLKEKLAFFHIFDAIGDYTYLPPVASRGMGDVFIIDHDINLDEISDWEIRLHSDSPYEQIEKLFFEVINNFEAHTE